MGLHIASLQNCLLLGNDRDDATLGVVQGLDKDSYTGQGGDFLGKSKVICIGRPRIELLVDPRAPVGCGSISPAQKECPGHFN